MFCSHCGASLNENSAFCQTCGTPVGNYQPDRPTYTYQSPYTGEVYPRPEQPADASDDMGGEDADREENAAQADSAPKEYNAQPVYTYTAGNSGGYAPRQNAAHNQQYQYYAPQQPKGGVAPVISTWHYVGLTLILSIPIVGLVMAFVWGFSDNINPNKKNYARSFLIMKAILVGLYLLLLILMLVIGAALWPDFYFNEGPYRYFAFAALSLIN
ncbi:MAG: zinc ribbon domain-containing protein [Christensenellales bacterium]|jgi:hypothetical protein